MHENYGGGVPFASVDATKIPSVWVDFGLTVIPTILVVGRDQAYVECSGIVALEKVDLSLKQAFHQFASEPRPLDA